MKFFIIFVTLFAVSLAAVSYQDYKVVKFTIENEEQLKKAQEMEIMDGVRQKKICKKF
jgi:hypothetical protein